MKKNNKMIVIGIAICVAIVAILTVMICLLASGKEENDLEYSPFFVTGQWVSDDYDFTITSTTKYYVDGDTEYDFISVTGRADVNDVHYNLIFNYVLSNGSSEKYNAIIYITDENGVIDVTCGYKFYENSFVLKDFSDSSIFGKEIHFKKIID